MSGGGREVGIPGPGGIPGPISGGGYSRSRVQDLPATDIWWSSLETCSNFFTGEAHLPPPTGTNTLWGHRNTYGCKRVVRILLECFLVLLVVSETHCTGNPFLRYLSPVFCPLWQALKISTDDRISSWVLIMVNLVKPLNIARLFVSERRKDGGGDAGRVHRVTGTKLRLIKMKQRLMQVKIFYLVFLLWTVSNTPSLNFVPTWKSSLIHSQQWWPFTEKWCRRLRSCTDIFLWNV